LVVDCVRFSRDGTRLVATASPDWFLNVWSANTGLQLASYYFGSSEGRALEAWFCADSGVACISAGLVAVNTTDTDHTTDVKLPHPITTWCSDGDYAWAVVDHHLVVRKVPDAQPVLRVAVREK
jgi:WD40 repeat protein